MMKPAYRNKPAGLLHRLFLIKKAGAKLALLRLGPSVLIGFIKKSSNHAGLQTA